MFMFKFNECIDLYNKSRFEFTPLKFTFMGNGKKRWLCKIIIMGLVTLFVVNENSLGIFLLLIIFWALIYIFLPFQVLRGYYKESEDNDFKLLFNFKEWKQMRKRFSIQLSHIYEVYEDKEVEYIKKKILPLNQAFLVTFKDYADIEMSKYKISSYIIKGVVVAIIIPIWNKFVDFTYMNFLNEIDLSSLNYEAFTIIFNIIIIILIILIVLGIPLVMTGIEIRTNKKEEFSKIIKCIEKAMKSE